MLVQDQNIRILHSDFTDENLVWLDAKSSDFSLHGIFFDETEKCFLRMPSDVAVATSRAVTNLNYNTAGGRIRFRTDSPTIAIAAILHRIPNRPNMTAAGISGFDLYRTDEDGNHYVQTFMPKTPTCDRYEKAARTDGCFREYTIHFPLYCGVKSLLIGLKKGARLESPSDYPNRLPVVFYGSSITQGSSASRPGISYEDYLSRKLGFDYINLGFSGACKAESSMAEYFASLPMKAFVYDFDHNVKNSEELEEKHLPFYRRIRSAHPDVPILFMSAPDVLLHKGDFFARREIIRKNFQRAKAEGDEKLWYIDGATLFGTEDHLDCTVDCTHPNDLGFYRMAQTIRPVLEEMLNK